MLEKFTAQLAAAQSLTPDEVRAAVKALVDESVPVTQKADFLLRFADKGETVEEIAAFAAELRTLSIRPPIEEAWRAGREILDVVGTGGDRAGTFNISTAVAILCAAAGVTVAKHGNRAATSRAGSADVLEALGIPILLTPEQAARALREHGFAFFFAPHYHPAFKHIGPARKLAAEKGRRTIFNFLGPLLNPARPTAMLVGVPDPAWCEPLGRVLQSLGTRRAMVVSGRCDNCEPGSETTLAALYLDELSTIAGSTIAEFYQERALTVSVLDHTQLPLQPATLKDLLGGDREANAAIVRDILSGKERGPKRDAVLLNAAAALFVAGAARSIGDGWEVAVRVIDSGAAAAKLAELAYAGKAN